MGQDREEGWLVVLGAPSFRVLCGRVGNLESKPTSHPERSEPKDLRLLFAVWIAIMIAMEAEMAQLLVRNLDDRLKARLQRRAKRNGQSMEAEARDILRNALRANEAQSIGFGTASVALFSGQGIGLKKGEEIREWRGFPLQPISFDK
jgi:plasmid stability protein